MFRAEIIARSPVKGLEALNRGNIVHPQNTKIQVYIGKRRKIVYNNSDWRNDMTITDELYEISAKKAKSVVWVLSDLQQSVYDNMKRCLDLCMEDYKSLGKPAEAIWYLGDAVEGTDPDNISRMVNDQEKAFSALNVPLTYVCGNHDYDFCAKAIREGRKERLYIPFYDMVKSHKDWHAAKSPSDPYFTQDFKDFKLFCFQDHIAEDLSWLSTHNMIRSGREVYPYKKEYFENIRKEMKECGKPVITIGHTSFPGGNRDFESEITSQILPLPMNVRLHLYGHSHIGEYTWPREKAFSQIGWVNWQDIPQIDVASFENIRGCYCHSVILHIYEDNSFGIFFRNHDKHRFESSYFPAYEKCEKENGYEEHVPRILEMIESFKKTGRKI